MKIAIIGGGPGGLYFAALMKQLDPNHEVTVWERNAASDTFGFGVVFSDETLGGIGNADTVIAEYMSERFARWTDIDIHFKGQQHTVGGQGFAAMSRKELLELLQRRCAELGVDLRFSTLAPGRRGTQPGLRPGPRRGRPELRRPLAASPRSSGPAWTSASPSTCGSAPTSSSRRSSSSSRTPSTASCRSTATRTRTRAAPSSSKCTRTSGAAPASTPPSTRCSGPAKATRRPWTPIRAIFAEELEGHEVLVNNSKWINFTTVRNESWRHGNIVLLGDAAHTAHFSIGSGTKLAMEDSLALAACLHEHAELESALEAYETERRPVVESTQRAAQASLEWFENIGMYKDQNPVQFCFNLLTRSRRITYDNLKLRDPEFAARVDEEFARTQGIAGSAPAMFQPYRIGGLELKNRIVVSPMDMYSATDGVPGNFHLVHLGSKALGGAGLVMTEMVCVSEAGRITPGCSGLYNEAQQESWREIVDFVHSRSTAAIGVQLGHSGRKGSTKLMWEGIDEPLPEGGWEPVGPSAIPYGPGSPAPREISRAEMDQVRDEFVAATVRAAAVGLRPAGAALRARLPALLLPLAAGQPARRRIRRIAGEPAALPAGGVRRRPRRVARGQAADRAAFGDGLGSRRQRRARRRRDCPGVRGARRRRRGRLLRPGGQGGEARLRPQLPDPVRGPDPAGSGRTRQAWR